MVKEREREGEEREGGGRGERARERETTVVDCWFAKQKMSKGIVVLDKLGCYSKNFLR